MTVDAAWPEPSAAWAALLPPGVVWRAGWIEHLAEEPHPLEASVVARAVPKRRREFSAGRRCAREALRALGDLSGPVLAGPDRAPIWPQGVVGSITHNDLVCAAAVARAAEIRGLGIDVDTISRFDETLTPALCTPREVQRWLDGRAQPQRRERLATIFSFKESFYKAQYAISRAWLGFHDVEVIGWDELANGRLALRLGLLHPPQARRGVEVPPAVVDALLGQAWVGHALHDGQQVWSSVVIPL